MRAFFMNILRSGKTFSDQDENVKITYMTLNGTIFLSILIGFITYVNHKLLVDFSGTLWLYQSLFLILTPLIPFVLLRMVSTKYLNYILYFPLTTTLLATLFLSIVHEQASALTTWYLAFLVPFMHFYNKATVILVFLYILYMTYYHRMYIYHEERIYGLLASDYVVLVFATVIAAWYYQYIMNNIKQLELANENLEEKVKEETKKRTMILENEKTLLSKQANYDYLTGLPNRTKFHGDLKEAVEASTKTNSKLAIFFLDLNRFKIINDLYGHVAGDTVLQTVSHRLRKAVGNVITLYRLGGDEFIILVKEAKSPSDLEKLAQKIVTVVEEKIMLGEEPLHISCAIGISIYPDLATTESALIKQADLAIINTKKSSTLKYQFYVEAFSHHLGYDRSLLERDLHLALLENQLLVYYQPQVDLKSRKIVSAEVLVRWEHPTEGLLEAEKFISLAYELGYIGEIDFFVLENGMKQITQWKKEKKDIALISFNVSTQTLESKNFLKKVQTLLAQTGCKPEWIECEIVEDHLISNKTQFLTVLTQLIEMGIKIAIDDFGKGYSSLAYIKEFPIERIKIDRSFVVNLPYEKRDVVIMHTIMALANNLGFKIVIEGVETKEQLAFFDEDNDNIYIQGFYFYKPMPQEELARLL